MKPSAAETELDSLRRRLAQLEAENDRLVRALAEAAMPAEDSAARDDAALLRLAQEAGGICSWQWDVATNALHWSDNCHALHGMNPAEEPTFERWIGGVHPEDRAGVETALQAALGGGSEGWDTEFRYIRHDDGVQRWLVGRGRILRDPADGQARRLIGIGFDVTDRKSAEERQTLLMRELDHRARNLLAVVQAAMRMTPKDDPAAYAAAVEGRIAALARAHAMLADARWTGSDLRRMLEGELSPFLDTRRVALSGPAVMLPAPVAQGLAMAVHELATNAVKHGALSAAGGRLSVAWEMEEAPAGATTLILRWGEAGGPTVRPPTRRGFGTRVLETTLRGQLRGSIALDWAAEGLSARLRVPLPPHA